MFVHVGDAVEEMAFTAPLASTPGRRHHNTAVLNAWRALQDAELAFAGALHDWDRSSAWQADGALSPTAWLAPNLGIGHGKAAGLLHFSRGITRYPAIADAIANGRISTAKADQVLHSFTPKRAAYAERDTELLIGLAEHLTVNECRIAMRRWAARVDAEIAEDPNNAGPDADDKLPSEVHLAPTLDGYELAGHLTTDDGALLRTAIESARRLEAGESTGDAPAETRSPATQRADAIVTLARFYLDHHASTSGTGAERPHVEVRIDLPVLTGHTGGIAHTNWAQTITASLAGYYACDASITRILTAESQVLDVGRATRTVSTPLRKAVVHRDRHCRFPGCAMPAPFTDAHHVHHWSHGGRTDKSNLALLCRRHHRMCHDGWTVAGNADDALTITAPDGTRYASHPPPTG